METPRSRSDDQMIRSPAPVIHRIWHRQAPRSLNEAQLDAISTFPVKWMNAMNAEMDRNGSCVLSKHIKIYQKYIKYIMHIYIYI